MNDLAHQVEQNAVKLKGAWESLSNKGQSSLPNACFEHWLKLATLHQQLSGTTPIFEARNYAWRIVQSLLTTDDNESILQNLVLYNAIKMDFSVARHLSLISYVSTTWSIYDRLSNVCGRLAGIAEISNKVNENPKVIDFFMADKKLQNPLGFTTNLHLKHSYEWPLRVSYKIRNWLVHEGFEVGDISLFKSNSIFDKFVLNVDAIEKIEKECNSNLNQKDKSKRTCAPQTDEIWTDRDLISILCLCDNEIDIMFSAFLGWSVDSFINQIKLFAARDKIQ
ncbi:MAG: hypothetical protein WCJ40_14150 [Planctomycetota bacterium]